MSSQITQDSTKTKNIIFIYLELFTENNLTNKQLHALEVNMHE